MLISEFENYIGVDDIFFTDLGHIDFNYNEGSLHVPGQVVGLDQVLNGPGLELAVPASRPVGHYLPSQG